MTWNDDKDAPSSTSSGRLDRADHGKKDALKKQIKEKFGTEKQTDIQKAELKSQMNLRELQSSISDEDHKNEEQKQQAAEAAEKSTAPKTKSLKQQEEAMTEDAHETIDTDTLLEREQSQPEISDEETSTQPG